MASAEPESRAFVEGLRAVVAGFGPAGFAAADNLLHLGAEVVVLEEDPSLASAEAELLTVLGAEIRRGPGQTATLPGEADLLVVTGAWTRDQPLVAQAVERTVPVWSDAELAWRVREGAAPWLVVAAPSEEPGALALVRMLTEILAAAGLRAVVAGRTGRPVVEVVMDPEPRDVVVAVLDDTQLDFVSTLSAHSAVVLLGDDDGGGLADLLGRAYDRVQVACVYAVSGGSTQELVREAEVVEGARAIGITLGMPSIGTLGLVEDLLADRAFVAERASSAAELATLGDLGVTGADADAPVVWLGLAAAALARAYGVPAAAVRAGLRTWSRGQS